MADNPSFLPTLGEVVRRHGLSAKRALGQHFLLDPNLTARIVRAAGDLTDADVIEVGPGPGGLTRALLAAGARRVVAIEKDDRCLAALAEIVAAYPGRLEIVPGDALEADVVALTSAPRCIVANLPYNVATPLLIGWLGHIDAFRTMTLMFQREVADRLTAQPGTKAYGRLSVLTQWLAETRRDLVIPARAFVPPPKVASAVVTLVPRRVPLAAAPRDTLEAVTQAAFGKRRKMLRQSLKPLGIDAAECGIDPRRRGETLSVEEFCILARRLAERRGKT